MKKFLTCLLIVFITFSAFSVIYGITYYEEVDFVTGIVTASALNVRSGPGTKFKSVGLTLSLFMALVL